MAQSSLPEIYATPNQIPQTGFVSGTQCRYPNYIAPDDLVVVDLAKRRIDDDGLYLLNATFGWSGCRKFQTRQDQLYCDESGHGDWNSFEPFSHMYSVVGKVISIKKGGAA